LYGTIFNLKIKAGHEEALLNVMNDATTSKPKGMVAWFVMKPDEKENWIGVGVFESKEAYIANANSPEQHETFLKFMDHLDEEPNWTDGTYVIGDVT
jgi:DNA-binding protein H-NS